MKHIGIIGVSSEGAGLCFQTICSVSAKRMGKCQHPEISLHELSTQLYFDAQPDWQKVASLLLISAKKLAEQGADFAIIPSNTMHFALEIAKKDSPIPFLSILDVAVNECIRRGFKKVGILGTTFTVDGGLYDHALRQVGIEKVEHSSSDQERINRIIFDGIVPGKVTPAMTPEILTVIASLKDKGAEAVILGCTELPILITDANSPIPTIDTTRLLAISALEEALG